MMRRIADKYDMAIITELMGEENLEDIVKYADIIQVGARNMQKFLSFKAIGKTNTPVMLKEDFLIRLKNG